MPQESDSSTDITRRDFLKRSTVAGTGVALGLGMGISLVSDEAQAANTEFITLDEYLFRLIHKKKPTWNDAKRGFRRKLINPRP